MNILHVANSLDSRAGGIVSVLLPLANYQARAGHSVTVCSTNAAFPKGKLKVPKNLMHKIDNVAYFYFDVDFGPLYFSSSLMHWLKQKLHSFDIVHIHGLYRFPVTYAAFLARKNNLPYIIAPHGALDPFLYKQSANNLFLKRLYERFFDLPNLHAAKAIHFTAKEEMNLTSFLNLKTKGIIIPNGIDWAAYSSLPAKGAFRKSINVDKEAPLILFLGRLNFKKGLDILTQSFSDLLAYLPSAKLAIVGPDNEGYGLKVRQWCQDLSITDSVIFVDHLPQKEVIQAYVDADVFVLTSYTENFGMTVVEAMASGCPVVISEHVNICHQVKEANAGYVLPLDIDLIVDAMKAILNDYETASIMGLSGRNFVQENFTWEIIEESLHTEYLDLI